MNDGSNDDDDDDDDDGNGNDNSDFDIDVSDEVYDDNDINSDSSSENDRDDDGRDDNLHDDDSIDGDSKTRITVDKITNHRDLNISQTSSSHKTIINLYLLILHLTCGISIPLKSNLIIISIP